MESEPSGLLAMPKHFSCKATSGAYFSASCCGGLSLVVLWVRPRSTVCNIQMPPTTKMIAPTVTRAAPSSGGVEDPEAGVDAQVYPCHNQAAEKSVTNPAMSVAWARIRLRRCTTATIEETTVDRVINDNGMPGNRCHPFCKRAPTVAGPASPPPGLPNKYQGYAAEAKARMAPNPIRAMGETSLLGAGGFAGGADAWEILALGCSTLAVGERDTPHTPQ